ncbi:uncharacterized protein LOC109706616 [Ananas comosus]|uniref:Uncharacterized protein LOC109706616 n=2 Tax=Ananas comosus TaxID=4615 RepID=A0A199VS69_ANACO|nr:uncharacterized protein LOC109706616 [Ananas comosus]OAY79848.1 hypothetical protein ACMD2_04223 [Ananas comosus]
MAITNTKTFQLLSRLRRAIHKVKFLLSFNPTRWVMFSIIGSSPGPQLASFSPRPSLADATDGVYVDTGASSFSSSSTGAVSRTSSLLSTPGGDDIDARADVFIANFYQHIRMEREVSLELRYSEREKSLERTRSD